MKPIIFLGTGLVILLLPVCLWSINEETSPKQSSPMQFREHLIRGKYGYAFGVAAHDLDGDGDLDLTSGDIIGKPSLSSLFWFENDGKGKFEQHTVWKGEPGWFERHAVGDINGDGKLDVAIVNNRDGHLIWFANNEKPAAGVWQRYVISTNCPRAYDVVLTDIDGDGDLDAAASGYASNLITWYENRGASNWDEDWPRRVIGEKMSEARMIRVADFNKDGKPDLLCAAVGVSNVPAEVTDVKQHASQLVWYENPRDVRKQNFWKKHVIDNENRAPIHGQPIDLDGDGDSDVVMAFGMLAERIPPGKHHIAWYENKGRKGQDIVWTKHLIGQMPFAFEAFPADLDRDGDIDVAATSWAKGDRVVWFENSGNPRKPWKQHLIRENWYAANQVIVADLNGDKRSDIIATADNGSSRVNGANELRWWENVFAK